MNPEHYGAKKNHVYVSFPSSFVFCTVSCLLGLPMVLVEANFAHSPDSEDTEPKENPKASKGGIQEAQMRLREVMRAPISVRGHLGGPLKEGASR